MIYILIILITVVLTVGIKLMSMYCEPSKKEKLTMQDIVNANTANALEELNNRRPGPPILEPQWPDGRGTRPVPPPPPPPPIRDYGQVQRDLFRAQLQLGSGYTFEN